MRIILCTWIIAQLFYLNGFDFSGPLLLTFLVFACILVLVLYGGFCKKLSSLRFILVVALTFTLAYLWTQYLDNKKIQNQLHPSLEDRTLVLRGYIDDLPVLSEKGTGFVLLVEDLKENFPNRISLFYPKSNVEHEFIPGQLWEFTVQIKAIRSLKNPHGFDFERWMYIRGIGAQGVIKKSKLKLLDTSWNAIYFFERLRYQIRKKMVTSLGKDSPYLGVINALVIGDQSLIASEDWKMFSATGIGHLISISGLHITMLAGFAAKVASSCWRRSSGIFFLPTQKMGVVFGFITALMYTFLAGFQIPAQRTTLMLGVSALGLFMGRIIHFFDIWLIALWIVLFLNPWAIYFPGFWLSFGAVAAILYGLQSTDHQSYDADELFLHKLKTSFLDACRVQAVVTIALIPVSLFWFYQISLISPIANALAIPVVSFITTPLAMLGAFLPGSIGRVLIRLSHDSFSLLADVLYPLANFEWSILYSAKPSQVVLLIATIGVLIGIRPGNLISTWLSRVFGLCLCLILFIPQKWLFWQQIPLGELELVVWDIGQGSAVLVKTKEHVLIYDTGPIGFGKSNPSEKVILPHLRAEGIKEVHQLVVSHEDSDHIGGLVHLIENFPIRGVIGSIPLKHSVHQVFQKKNLSFRNCEAGQKWQWDGIDFIIWHPGFDQQYLKPNERSCVLEVRNQYHSIWLTGDVEKKGEAMIQVRVNSMNQQLEEIVHRKVLLMAPHHGSKTSSSEGFIDILQPDAVFSQTGYKNRYHHPHPIILQRYQSRGLDLLDTVQTGAQIWRTEHQQLHFKALRGTPSP
jgi:competence protein ComEC